MEKHKVYIVSVEEYTDQVIKKEDRIHVAGRSYIFWHANSA